MRRLVSWGFLGAKAGRPDRAARRVEESFSALEKQGKLYFFKSSQTSRERRFGSLCNQVLPKTLRFSLQRHKTAKSCAFCDSLPVLALELGTPHPNSAPLNSGLWLGAFGKVWLFRCQSGIRGLWLEAFGKKRFFRCQSTPGPPKPCFPYLMPAVWGFGGSHSPKIHNGSIS